jgi:hypothetical protein
MKSNEQPTKNPRQRARAKLTRIRNLYGIPISDYEKMLQDSKNKCAICKEESEATLHVDHCHSSGKVRGLLCKQCNNGLGLIKENITTIKNMIAYIKLWEYSSWEWLDLEKPRYKYTKWDKNDFKKCKICEEWKNYDIHFARLLSYNDKRHPHCKGCHAKFLESRINKSKIKYTKKIPMREGVRIKKDSSLFKSYGISISDYETILDIQNNKCFICSTDEPGGNREFNVDHDHKTNKVRGLLCIGCNLGLACFKENIEFLNIAIQYLEKHSYSFSAVVLEEL